jgi:DNA-binding CsgD family transcriptional regulator
LIARHAAGTQGPDAVAALRAAAADLEHAPLHAAELLAIAATRVTDDSAEADAIAVERAGALAISGQVDAAERVARERLARSTDPATRAALRSLLLFSLISAAQVDAALDEIEASLARAPTPEAREALTDTRRWVTLLAGRQTLHGPPAEVARSPSGLVTDALELFLVGRPDEGYERAMAAIRLRTQNPPPSWSGSPSAPVWPAFLALHVFGPRRARELSIEARREVQKGGRLWLTPYHQSVSAGINFHAGAWDDALAELESGMEAAVATGTAWTSMAISTQLQILVRRGELDTADATLRHWHARALPEQFGFPHVAQGEVLLLEAREQLQEAAALAHRNWHRALNRGRRIWPLLAGPDTMRVARAAHDTVLAARVAHDTAAVPVEHAPALAPAVRLVAAVAAGNAREATAAALDYRALGNVPGEISAWEETACLTAASGAPDEARTAATRATALAATLGATTVERRVSARLRQLDVRLGSRTGRRRPSTGWGSLTPTELQVADLVGQGLTSPQVAARLYISPRTVQTHITHILRKLGLRSRVELAAALSRRSPH